jgi:hypothetical protein
MAWAAMPDDFTSNHRDDMDKLDEVALRRPDFLGGEPIEMADGQAWILPKPMMEFVPKFAADGTITAGVATSLGPDFDRIMEDYDEACRASINEDADYQGPRPMDVMMAIGVRLLQVNYDIDRDTLAGLLRWRPDDESSTDRWRAITNVARGISLAGKPRAGGSA